MMAKCAQIGIGFQYTISTPLTVFNPTGVLNTLQLSSGGTLTS